MVYKEFHWSEDLADVRVFGKAAALKMVNGLVDAGYFAGLRMVNDRSRVKVYSVHFEREKDAYRLANELKERYERNPYD